MVSPLQRLFAQDNRPKEERQERVNAEALGEGRSMTTEPKDDAREERITMEIIVDANSPEEQASGWYYSLEETMQFPFLARCRTERAMSPLRIGDEAEVVGLAPEEECRHEMFVETPWERRTLAVPLSQLEGMTADEATQQAIEDWHYWVKRGYEL